MVTYTPSAVLICRFGRFPPPRKCDRKHKGVPQIIVNLYHLGGNWYVGGPSASSAAGVKFNNRSRSLYQHIDESSKYAVEGSNRVESFDEKGNINRSHQRDVLLEIGSLIERLKKHRLPIAQAFRKELIHFLTSEGLAKAKADCQILYENVSGEPADVPLETAMDESDAIDDNTTDDKMSTRGTNIGSAAAPAVMSTSNNNNDVLLHNHNHNRSSPNRTAALVKKEVLSAVNPLTNATPSNHTKVETLPRLPALRQYPPLSTSAYNPVNTRQNLANAWPVPSLGNGTSVAISRSPPPTHHLNLEVDAAPLPPLPPCITITIPHSATTITALAPHRPVAIHIPPPPPPRDSPRSTPSPSPRMSPSAHTIADEGIVYSSKTAIGNSTPGPDAVERPSSGPSTPSAAAANDWLQSTNQHQR